MYSSDRMRRNEILLIFFRHYLELITAVLRECWMNMFMILYT